MQRVFGPAVQAAGWELVAPDVRGADMATMVSVVRESRPDAVGGVSLGAHAAALFASRDRWMGPVYAVMPAWVGDPEAVAALTEHTAQEISVAGVEAVLARLEAQAPGDWIVAELARAWRSMPAEALVQALLVAGQQPAPAAEDLARIRGPLTVVGLADDPTHPLAVAKLWAAVTRTQVQLVDRHEGPHALAKWLTQVLGGGA